MGTQVGVSDSSSEAAGELLMADLGRCAVPLPKGFLL